MAPSVRLTSVDGEPGVLLHAGRTSLTVLPQLGLLGASLRFDDAEYLSLHGGLDAWRGGHTTGLPILYPWANRLEGFTYRAGGTGVSLEGAPHLHLDANGLPIHGTMAAQPAWELTGCRAGKRVARLGAAFAFDEHPELLESFPYPHHLEVGLAVRDGSVTVATTVVPTGDRPVPVSFGWHPYFVLPGVPHDDLVVLLPKRRHLELDGQQLPTGREEKEAAETVPLAGRALDECYRLGKDRVLGFGGGGGGVTVELGDGYDHAQVYSPAGAGFVALEPMTAPVNALVDGVTPMVEPGDRFTATFTIRVGHG